MIVNKGLISSLKRAGVIKTGDVRLISGEKSDIYFDLKSLAVSGCYGFDSTDIAMTYIAQLVSEVISRRINNEVEAVLAAGGLGAVSIMTGLIYIQQQSFRHTPVGTVTIAFGVKGAIGLILRDSSDHGLKHKVEGNVELAKKSDVYLLEDVLSTGTSAKKYINILKDEGIVPKVVIAIVDRSNTILGVPLKEIEGIPVIALTTQEDFLPHE